MKKTRFISSVLAICMIFSCISVCAAGDKIALSSSKLEGYNKITPEQNLFYIEGYPNKKFIVLDCDSSGFLILANEIYGTASFDSDNMQKFDVNKQNNIAYYLNNDFLKDDNFLPPEIVPYIDYKRVWKTEGGNDSGACPKSYDTVCGVSLLSYTEFLKYYGKIGLFDDAARVNWWLRSPLGGDLKALVVSGGTYTDEGKLKSANASLAMGVRPLFWVNKNFFADVKVNISQMGENIKKSIVKNISAQFLKDGKAQYNDYELKRMGYNIKGVPGEYVKFDFPNQPLYAKKQKKCICRG